MHQNPIYTLIKIEDTYHILPVAQGIADMRRGIQINESGASIWTLLETLHSRDELLSALKKDTSISSEEVDRFLDSLIHYGFIINSDISDAVTPHGNDTISSATNCKNVSKCENALDNQSTQLFSADELGLPLFKTIKIGTIGLRLFGDSKLFVSNLSSFETDELSPVTADVTVSIVSNPTASITTTPEVVASIATMPEVTTSITTMSEATASAPSKLSTATGLTPAAQVHQLITCTDFSIFACPDTYIIKYPDTSTIERVIFSADGRKTNIFIKNTDNITDSMRDEIFHSIRLPFLYLAEKHGLYAIHSASVLYQQKAWLFSASSGTGKSTLARMWTDNNFASDINGDLNLLGISGGIPVVYGLPWCGTSNIYTAQTYPLGGIIFLKRAKINKTDLSDSLNGLLSMSKRIISPLFSPADLNKLFDDLKPIADNILFFNHYCTNSIDSLIAVKQAIDTGLK